MAAIHAKALVERGHEVVLISPPPEPIPLRRKIKSFVSGRGWPGSVRNPSHLDGLQLDHRVLEQSRPVHDLDVPDGDVVIATWWETAEWVGGLSDRKGAKVYFVQGHEVHEHLPVERSRATYSLPLKKIVVSKWLQEIMHEEYGDADVDLVPNSVDHSQFFSCIRGKQRFPTVGFLYSRTGIKGAASALQVIERLRTIFPELHVVSFGSCKPVEMEGFDERIEFHLSPEQDKIRNIYASCDVWLSTSRSEGFNLPVMEAMACRTPVVATRTGWPEEAITSGRNGVLAEVDDVAALVRGCESILSMSEREWMVMSGNAYDTVASSNWHASAELFEQALARAAKRHRDNPGAVSIG